MIEAILSWLPVTEGGGDNDNNEKKKGDDDYYDDDDDEKIIMMIIMIMMMTMMMGMWSRHTAKATKGFVTPAPNDRSPDRCFLCFLFVFPFWSQVLFFVSCVVLFCDVSSLANKRWVQARCVSVSCVAGV